MIVLLHCTVSSFDLFDCYCKTKNPTTQTKTIENLSFKLIVSADIINLFFFFLQTRCTLKMNVIKMEGVRGWKTRKK